MTRAYSMGLQLLSWYQVPLEKNHMPRKTLCRKTLIAVNGFAAQRTDAVQHATYESV